jgi:hypothetical protein
VFRTAFAVYCVNLTNCLVVGAHTATIGLSKVEVKIMKVCAEMKHFTDTYILIRHISLHQL